MAAVIINDQHGGFGWSEEALAEYTKRTGLDDPMGRTDAVAIQILRDLGTKRASDEYSHLVIKEVDPLFAVGYRIDEYNGQETLVFSADRWIASNVNRVMSLTDIGYEEKILKIQLLYETKFSMKDIAYDQFPFPIEYARASQE